MTPDRRGHPGDDPAQWPTHLRQAVVTYGGDLVHLAGIETLGYPPAWTVGPSELNRSFGHFLTQRSTA